MAYINGYKYISEQEAINAREECDAYYGIPVAPDDITQNWVEYSFAELNKPQFWYIVFDETLQSVLGNPEEFEVIDRPLPNETRN